MNKHKAFKKAIIATPLAIYALIWPFVRPGTALSDLAALLAAGFATLLIWRHFNHDK